MKIVMKNVADVIPYANNPRHNDDAVDYVANSIKEFGFKVPIIIDKDNVIVAGHTRLKASEKLGLKEVPCIIADDLTDDQIKAFRLADNKVGEIASWDFNKLEFELSGIDEIDMEQFGFEDIEVDTIGGQFHEDEDDPYDDIEKLETHYGVPYQGNKSRIADIIINLLPSGKRLVDLFGGGGAITHCGILSEKWEAYLYNDLNPMITGLFMDAVHGKYHDERRVITREDFNALKDTDAYVKYIWSFGNGGNAYLWGKDIEEIKCTACHSLIDETLTERRLAYVHFVKMLKNCKDPTPNRLAPLERLQALTQLEALQRLEAFQRLEALQRLEVTNIDYRDYKYQDGDVVYCDVPYEKNAKGECNDYGVEFNSLEFYEWVKKQNYPVFFSSYEISDDSFYSTKIKKVMSLFGATTNGNFAQEYLYSNIPLENIGGAE